MSKTIAWIIVAIVVIGGGIWWWTASHNNGAASSASNNGTSTASLPQGNSDQAINQEMTDVNAQLSGLSSDSASVDQSINDQPVQQAQ